MKLNIQLFADGSVVIPVDLDSKGFDRQIAKVEYELEELEETYKIALSQPDEWSEKDLIDMEAEIQKLTNKLTTLKEKQAELNKIQFNFGQGFKSGLKSLTRMGLAVFGIRSAYMLIRQSANQLAQSNDEMAGKLEAIKGSLANAIAPIAEVLVNLVYRLLGYLNAITKVFFGIDLFKKTAKSGKSAVGSAQKLRKILAGFDEMNVLNDTSGGGGGGGTKTPEFEPPDTSGAEKIIENLKKQWIELTDISREQMRKMLLSQDKTWGLFKLGWFDTIQGIAQMFRGLGETFGGVFKIIKGVALGDTKLIEDGIEQAIIGIKRLLYGLLQTLEGIAEMIGGVVWGLIKTILGFFSNLFQTIINSSIHAYNQIIGVFNKIGSFFGSIISKVLDLFSTFGGKAGQVVASAFKSVVNAVLKTIENMLNAPIKAINGLIGIINKVPGVNLSRLNTFSFPRLAKGGIINMPGRGIPLATGGERGAEGVIPLTDSQQMALLGEAIGKYISLNATIPVYVGNRQIARELRKIETENAFAGNR